MWFLSAGGDFYTERKGETNWIKPLPQAGVPTISRYLQWQLLFVALALEDT